jgi:hypothetical protein
MNIEKLFRKLLQLGFAAFGSTAIGAAFAKLANTLDAIADHSTTPAQYRPLNL